MRKGNEQLDADQTKARDRVLAWFGKTASTRESDSAISQPAATVKPTGTDWIKIVGTIVCLIYAVVWLLGWKGAPQFHSYGKNIPIEYAGLVVFMVAPFLRTQGRTAKWVCALGILALCGEGLWLVLKSIVKLQAAITLEQTLLWVIVPIGILVWVLTGPPNDEADRQYEQMQKERAAVWPIVIPVLIVGLLLAALGAAFLLMKTSSFP